MEELIKRLERVIQTGAPDKDGMHPISAETVLEVVKGLSEHGTNLAEVGTDLVSRQALLDKFEPWLKVKDYNDGELNMLKAILYEIRFMRSAQPEIIRCKDCKHWIPYDWMFSEIWQSKNIADYPEDEIGCEWSDMSMKANDFCSVAEKREVTT